MSNDELRHAFVVGYSVLSGLVVLGTLIWLGVGLRREAARLDREEVKDEEGQPADKDLSKAATPRREEATTRPAKPRTIHTKWGCSDDPASRARD